MSSSIFVRMLIAALFVVFLFLAIPLFFAAIDFSIDGPLLALFKLVVVAIAVFYVFTGKPAIY